jgi:DNA-binding cell septation regulator SpoVG
MTGEQIPSGSNPRDPIMEIMDPVNGTASHVIQAAILATYVDASQAAQCCHVFAVK